MRICIIGKFPPIQGGVSMRTYWTAHGLAERGHEVHVVTNAKEARPPFRMHMRAEDWKRCEAMFDAGSVIVHWADPVDRSQSYIPMASPFVSKLAAIAARVHSEQPFDLILSYYMEPYGVAGHLAAQMAGVPHVVRMAGSDAGRLWHHPQFEALYDHVLRSAAVVIAGGAVAERAFQRGVDPRRIAYGGGFVVPEDLFTPVGPRLDFASLRSEIQQDSHLRHLLWGDFATDRPYFGICGKLGESKGSFALLAAMHRLKRAGLDIGLVALAHGQPAVERSFRARARTLGLADRILQFPFLPHWRVPEFLRGCVAVCCLEQDFPIEFHTPIIPCEVLLCGTCLVASTEVIRKLPAYGRLPHGYGCVAIEDVNDIDALSDQLSAIVQDPKPVAAVGARGSIFARELQRDISFPHMLEGILEAAAARQPVPSMAVGSAVDAVDAEEDCFPLTQLAEHAIGKTDWSLSAAEATAPRRTIDLARAREVLIAIERAMANGQPNLESLASAVQIEVSIAAAEIEPDEPNSLEARDPLFRLFMRRWAMAEGDIGKLVPMRDPRLRVIEFNFDVSDFMGVGAAAEFPARPAPRRSYIAAFRRSNDDGQRSPVMIDRLTARMLELSDGTRTALEVVRELDQQGSTSSEADNVKWMENLFVQGLISLRDERVDPSSNLY